MHINRHLTPTHRGFKLLRKLSTCGMAGPHLLSSKVSIRPSRAKSELDTLERLGLVTICDAIVMHEIPYALSAKGHDALQSIQGWHEQGWLKRTFGPPPPSI